MNTQPAQSTEKNAPISFDPLVTEDELAGILGQQVPGATFVFRPADGRIVACNVQFLKATGRFAADSEDCEQLRWREVLSVSSQERFLKVLLESLAKGEVGRCEVELVDRRGVEIPVRIELANLLWKQTELCVGFVTFIAEERRLVEGLKREVDEQKNRTLSAIGASLRVYTLTEKIKWAPVLTRNLLRVEDETGLFEETAELFTGEEGLNYRAVTFYLKEGDDLRLALSSSGAPQKTYPKELGGELWEFVESGQGTADAPRGAIYVRLESRGELLGVSEVLPYDREKVLFGGAVRLKTLEGEFLSAVGDIIALLLDNMRLNREIKRQSVIDPLTQVFNRRHFMVRLNEEMQRASRYGRPVSLIFVDIDRFKQINDVYGHLQGDRVLKELGQVLRSTFRETDIICRYGGDEFVVLLPESDPASALEAAEKLIRAVRERLVVEHRDTGETAFVTVSAGVSTLAAKADAEAFLHAADEALLKAKSAGRNQIASSS